MAELTNSELLIQKGEAERDLSTLPAPANISVEIIDAPYVGGLAAGQENYVHSPVDRLNEARANFRRAFRRQDGGFGVSDTAYENMFNDYAKITMGDYDFHLATGINIYNNEIKDNDNYWRMNGILTGLTDDIIQAPLNFGNWLFSSDTKPQSFDSPLSPFHSTETAIFSRNLEEAKRENPDADEDTIAEKVLEKYKAAQKRYIERGKFISERLSISGGKAPNTFGYAFGRGIGTSLRAMGVIWATGGAAAPKYAQVAANIGQIFLTSLAQHNLDMATEYGFTADWQTQRAVGLAAIDAITESIFEPAYNIFGGTGTNSLASVIKNSSLWNITKGGLQSGVQEGLVEEGIAFVATNILDASLYGSRKTQEQLMDEALKSIVVGFASGFALGLPTSVAQQQRASQQLVGIGLVNGIPPDKVNQFYENVKTEFYKNVQEHPEFVDELMATMIENGSKPENRADFAADLEKELRLKGAPYTDIADMLHGLTAVDQNDIAEKARQDRIEREEETFQNRIKELSGQYSMLNSQTKESAEATVQMEARVARVLSRYEGLTPLEWLDKYQPTVVQGTEAEFHQLQEKLRGRNLEVAIDLSRLPTNVSGIREINGLLQLLAQTDDENQSRELVQRINNVAAYIEEQPVPQNFLDARNGYFSQGYDTERNKSNNAVEAEEAGLVNASTLGKKVGVSAAVINATVDAQEWHHTGRNYQKTKYYNPNITADDIQAIKDYAKNPDNYYYQPIIPDDAPPMIKRFNYRYLDYSEANNEMLISRARENNNQEAIDYFTNNPIKFRRMYPKSLETKGYLVYPDTISTTSSELSSDYRAMRAEAMYERYNQGERGATYIPANIIFLFESADKSTLIHELAHTWFQIMIDTNNPITDAIMSWLEVSTAYQNLDANMKNKIHEGFARGFEAYLREGNAPTSELIVSFEGFKTWLTEIYNAVDGVDTLPTIKPINNEVRGFFAMMLSQQRGQVVKENEVFDIIQRTAGTAEVSPTTFYQDAVTRIRSFIDELSSAYANIWKSGVELDAGVNLEAMKNKYRALIQGLDISNSQKTKYINGISNTKTNDASFEYMMDTVTQAEFSYTKNYVREINKSISEIDAEATDFDAEKYLRKFLREAHLRQVQYLRFTREIDDIGSRRDIASAVTGIMHRIVETQQANRDEYYRTKAIRKVDRLLNLPIRLANGKDRFTSDKTIFYHRLKNVWNKTAMSEPSTQWILSTQIGAKTALMRQFADDGVQVSAQEWTDFANQIEAFIDEAKAEVYEAKQQAKLEKRQRVNDAIAALQKTPVMSKGFDFLFNEVANIKSLMLELFGKEYADAHDLAFASEAYVAKTRAEIAFHGKRIAQITGHDTYDAALGVIKSTLLNSELVPMNSRRAARAVTIDTAMNMYGYTKGYYEITNEMTNNGQNPMTPEQILEKLADDRPKRATFTQGMRVFEFYDKALIENIIFKELDAKYREVVDYMIDVMGQGARDLREHIRETRNETLLLRPWYYPRTYENDENFFDEEMFIGNIERYSATRQALVDTPKLMPKLNKSATTTFFNYLNNINREYYFSKDYEDFGNVLKAQDFKAELENKFGKDRAEQISKSLSQTMDLMSKSFRDSRINPTLEKILNKLLTAKIAVNFDVFFGQISSLIWFSQNISDKGWFYKQIVHNFANFREVAEYIRKILYFNSRFNQVFTEDALYQIQSLDIQKEIGRRNFLTKLTALSRFGDQIANVVGAKALIDWNIKQGMSEEQAIRIAIEQSYTTQQSSNPSSQSAQQVAGWNRLFQAFKSQPVQSVRKIFDSWLLYKQGEVTAQDFAQTVWTFYKSQIMFNILNGLIRTGISMAGLALWGDDDEKEDFWQDFLLGFGTSIALSPLDAFGAMGAMLSWAATYTTMRIFGRPAYEFSLPLIQDFTRVVHDVGSLADSLFSWDWDEKDLLALLNSSSLITDASTGLPTNKYLGYIRRFTRPLLN